MIDKTYVKDLERLIAKQEKRIHRLEKEKMIRERGAAALVEYIITENETIDNGIKCALRGIMGKTKYYPLNGERNSNFCADAYKDEYESLEKFTKQIFGVNLSSLRDIGLHIDIVERPSKSIDTDDIDVDSLNFDGGPVFL
jgi:hypothetical protein